MRYCAPRCALALILVTALASCGSHQPLASASGAGTAAVVNGPAADYPMVIGDPYRVGANLYTPTDVMNYDEVGYAAADTGTGITASHHTLPLPSYIEVTSLVTGNTILVRVTRRGPMSGDAVVALSPAAFAQLGASTGDPVRVRRVNPPEEERAALRAGRTAPARMDTPSSLVAVLKRKLSGTGPVALASRPSTPPAAIQATQVPASEAAKAASVQAAVATKVERKGSSGAPPLPPLTAEPKDHAAKPRAVLVARQEPTERTAATPKPGAKAPAHHDAYVVQAAAMSTLERANKVAARIGGSVSHSGRYFRVRTGPFTTRAEAEASLANVRSAGYSDARISTNG
jgi:rare lipoprotein A